MPVCNTTPERVRDIQSQLLGQLTLFYATPASHLAKQNVQNACCVCTVLQRVQRDVAANPHPCQGDPFRIS
jgi:hypothetical protein